MEMTPHRRLLSGGAAVEAPFALLAGLAGGVPMAATPLRLAHRVQEGVQLRVVDGAHLHRPRAGIGRVYVVAVDGPAAAAGGVPEEDLNDAIGAREGSPRLRVV